ncbi:MAG: ATP-binding protein [Coriobacteriales bacterium]|jgi:predicted AAA+ superfamily ATPase|nr:ATP-binding protein [Coriobacteriales bacterium]
MIERPHYLNRLVAFKDTNLIKILTGVRRCGKSTLLKLYRQWLESAGVASDAVVGIDLDLLEFEGLREHHALHDHIGKRLGGNARTYVFIDEVQRCPHFEDAVESIFASGVADIYLTGSNARLFSSGLATLLSGRYVEIPILPLSFKEYLSAQASGREGHLSREQAFARYVRYGSLPEITNLPSDEQVVSQYLEGVFSSILVNDIVERHEVRDVAALKRIARFLYGNIGSFTSAASVSNALTSAGHRLSQPTAESYLGHLSDSLLFYAVERFDVRGKEHLRHLPKYYSVDTGLRNHALGFRPGDRGHVLENIVYLELCRRGYRVSVGKLNGLEIDFVAQRPQETLYVQVSESVVDPRVLERELTPLRRADGFHGRLLLTQDHDPQASYEGIAHHNILDWLLAD